MAKVKVKGTVIKQTISTVLTAVAQIIDFTHDGAESETYDATTIDTTGAGKEYSQTGYSEGGNFNFSLFYDPALSGHKAINIHRHASKLRLEHHHDRYRTDHECFHFMLSRVWF